MFPSVLFCSVLLIHATHRHTLSMRLQYIKWITSYTTSHHIPLLKNESYHTPPLSHTTRLLLKMIHCLSICQHFTTSESNKPILIIILKEYFIVISKSKIKWKRKWGGNEVRITCHGITEGKIDREKKKQEEESSMMIKTSYSIDKKNETLFLRELYSTQFNSFNSITHDYTLFYSQLFYTIPSNSINSVLFVHGTRTVLFYSSIWPTRSSIFCSHLFLRYELIPYYWSTLSTDRFIAHHNLSLSSSSFI